MGWPLKPLIVVIGLVVIFYTVIGGTAAVNVDPKTADVDHFFWDDHGFWIHSEQFPAGNWHHTSPTDCWKTGKLQVLDFSLDPNSRYTFWSGITGGLFLALSYFGTDQSQVQRYLSGKSIKESQMGLIMNGFLKVLHAILYPLGRGHGFVFYQFESAPLHFNPKGVETVLHSSQADAYRALEKEHLATQKQRHSLLTANLDSASLEQIALLDTKEQQQRQQAKTLIEQADPDQENQRQRLCLYLLHLGVFTPRAYWTAFGCDSLRRHELYCFRN